MPHLVILYTSNLESQTDMTGLCRQLADAMLRVRDENGKAVCPPGGVRVFAYPATHFAVADGKRDYGFIYLNLRIARGRSSAAKQSLGDALFSTAKSHLGALFEGRHVGMTLQIDEGQPVFDARHGTIHPLFAGG